MRAIGLANVHAEPVQVPVWRRGEDRARIVLRHEMASGALLGGVLGVLGALRVFLWESLFHPYKEHASGVALTIFLTIAGIVMWGSMVGSMLPFLLRRLRLDPASASAPFVATLVDVTGILIYFATATVVLGEVLR